MQKELKVKEKELAEARSSNQFEITHLKKEIEDEKENSKRIDEERIEKQKK